MTEQEMKDLCNRLSPCARTNVGKRALIERTIARSQKWHQNHRQTILVLVNPVAHDGDIIDWTWASPSAPAFRETVTNRIHRGYLPIGLLDGTVLSAMADSVPAEYQKDFLDFANIEAEIIYRTNHGQMSKDMAWTDDLEEKDGKLEFKTGAGKSLHFHLMDWNVESEN
jgi:hypothetical protein